ncbi:hypothetical protein X766_34170 [Mesorhizobium sp. LSJC255A00]|nr:hypothetical protein X766_34170 [Mesorhizobium sp. LSJC255A00]
MRRETKEAEDMRIIGFRLQEEKQMRACLQHAAPLEIPADFQGGIGRQPVSCRCLPDDVE